MRTPCYLLVALACSTAAAVAQFTPRWLQDEVYWGDGKAEFNLYDAQEVRYGQPRPCEVVHILVREPFSTADLVKAEPGSKAGTYPVIKLNQVLHVPTGIYVYQQMHSAFWRVSDGALIKATLTSNDSCGNTYKEFRALSGLGALLGAGWRYEWRTYWEGMAAGDENVRAPKDATFYDELPFRVRTIDFSAGGSGEFGIQLAPTIVGSKHESPAFKAARVKWTRSSDSIQVEVLREPREHDTFTLEASPPHSLKAWKRSDGGSYRLKRSLKIDYWNYNKVGDRERAVAPEPN